jgi:iron complex outermembrane receptor protein
VITHKPTFETTGDIRLEVGNYERIAANAAVNTALNEKLAVRLAGFTIQRDGFYKDGTFDEISQGGRLSLRADPSDTLSIVITGDYAHDGGRGSNATLLTSRAARGQPSTGKVRFVGDPLKPTPSRGGARFGILRPSADSPSDAAVAVMAEALGLARRNLQAEHKGPYHKRTASS